MLLLMYQFVWLGHLKNCFYDPAPPPDEIIFMMAAPWASTPSLLAVPCKLLRCSRVASGGDGDGIGYGMRVELMIGLELVIARTELGWNC